MPDSPTSHRDVIDRWPSLRSFADDIGVPYGTAKQMRRRNSIPNEYRVTVVNVAIERQIPGITFELLTLTAPARGTAAPPLPSPSPGRPHQDGGPEAPPPSLKASAS
jgi:hypothetical protein